MSVTVGGVALGGGVGLLLAYGYLGTWAFYDPVTPLLIATGAALTAVAQEQARRLDALPSVILDTRERLFLRSPGIEETGLPDSGGFHYRYRHLRLLIAGHNRMFLVPATWSASDSTLVVPISDSARVQFQFQF